MYIYIYIHTHDFEEDAKLQFPRLSTLEDSLGVHHFFEEFQKSRGVDVGVYRKPYFPFPSECSFQDFEA
jgi:hypothetical protein